MRLKHRNRVYVRGGMLWLYYRVGPGTWKRHSTNLPVGSEREAKNLLEKIATRIAAGQELGDADLGPVTVTRYAKRWVEERKALGIGSHVDDEIRLRLYILPQLGDMRLDEVRPRDVQRLMKWLYAKGDAIAPRTIGRVSKIV